ncbi:MAG: hypothetical protein KDA88_01380 [Planctomycetaceae bacterium]|nr:hypothetical protein [Planctomycetaceae bacterium]MCB9950721.1 hypothetical protein [Planctomycetaceae bacterium]
MSKFPLAWVIGNVRGMTGTGEAVMQSAQHVSTFSGIDDALNVADDQPDLIVVCQQHPDEYTQAEVNQLLEQFPLTRTVCVVGRWCLSMRRTRDVWPPALLIEAEQAKSRIQRELDVFRGNRTPLPRTAALEEVYAFDFA